VQPLVRILEEIYGSEKESKLAYIIVNKRTNSRFFKPSASTYINPKPGTVIDTGVTMKNRNE
jgi:Piwi domain